MRQDGEDTVEVGTVGQAIMDLTHPEENQSLVCHGGEGSGEADTSEQAMRDQVQPEVNTGLVCQLDGQDREETGHAGTGDQRESSQAPNPEVNTIQLTLDSEHTVGEKVGRLNHNQAME